MIITAQKVRSCHEANICWFSKRLLLFVWSSRHFSVTVKVSDSALDVTGFGSHVLYVKCEWWVMSLFRWNLKYQCTLRKKDYFLFYYVEMKRVSYKELQKSVLYSPLFIYVCLCALCSSWISLMLYQLYQPFNLFLVNS